VAAQTKGAKYLERLMCSDDVVQYDLVQRHDAVLRRANDYSDYSDGNKGTEFRTYISIYPNGTIHPMYIRNAVSVPDRDRLWATQLRLSSHRLAIETGRWSRIPRDNIIITIIYKAP